MSRISSDILLETCALLAHMTLNLHSQQCLCSAVEEVRRILRTSFDVLVGLTSVCSDMSSLSLPSAIRLPMIKIARHASVPLMWDCMLQK